MISYRDGIIMIIVLGIMALGANELYLMSHPDNNHKSVDKYEVK